jgi:hypothetical protein
LVAAGVACVVAACAGDSEKEGQSRAGVRGESCQSSRDCSRGLACVGGSCRVETFDLAPTGKECVRVECREALDCCRAIETQSNLSEECDQFRADCEAGDTIACSTVDISCCNPDDWACEDDSCLEICSSDTDCPIQQVCDGGRCVECVNDGHCEDDERCIDNECIVNCEKDTDCAVFHECQEGSCVEVGCKTTRECVAATMHPLAFCEDTECVVPCEADFECSDYDEFTFHACVDGQCASVGCETNEECRAQLDIGANSVIDAECREASK